MTDQQNFNASAVELVSSIRSIRSGRIIPGVILTALVAACGSAGTDGGGAGESASEVQTTTSLVPNSDITIDNVWAAGGSAPIYKLVDDGTSFAASDTWHTFARSAPGVANAAATFGYSGAPAGGAGNVVVNYQGWALDGGKGSVRVKLYSGTTLIGTGPLHTVTATTQNFSDTFSSLSVSDANQLRTELDFINAAPSGTGTLGSSIIWIDIAPLPVAGWKLVWSDEFNGTAIDSTKWNVRNNTHDSNELSCLTSRPQNVSVSGGALTIHAQKETYNCGVTRSYTSGYIDTIQKASWTYGRFEMRAILPTQANTSKGMWPAFWLRPNDGGVGEVDIMEAVGSATGDTEYTKAHQTIWYDYVGTHPSESIAETVGSGGPAAGYHIYAVEWSPGSLVFSVDGATVYTRGRTTTSWFDEAFSRPFNIRLNLQVGGSWPGTPNAETDFSKTYTVDYVRVYQK